MKPTLKRKIEVMNVCLNHLHTRNLQNYLCNIIFDESHSWESGIYPTAREKYIKSNFPEFLEYKPKDLPENRSWWFRYENVKDRLKIVNDLIYRYEKAIRYKKSVNQIKSKIL